MVLSHVLEVAIPREKLRAVMHRRLRDDAIHRAANGDALLSQPAKQPGGLHVTVVAIKPIARAPSAAADTYSGLAGRL